MSTQSISPHPWQQVWQCNFGWLVGVRSALPINSCRYIARCQPGVKNSPVAKTFGIARGTAHKRGHKAHQKPVCQTGEKKIHFGHPKRWLECPVPFRSPFLLFKLRTALIAKPFFCCSVPLRRCQPLMRSLFGDETERSSMGS